MADTEKPCKNYWDHLDDVILTAKSIYESSRSRNHMEPESISKEPNFSQKLPFA